MADEPKQERRKASGRRKLDKVMEQNIAALQAAHKESHAMLVNHLDECSRNYAELKKVVTPLADWIEPQISRARSKAETWDRVVKTVQTEWMVAMLKYGPPIILLALLAAVFPSAAELIQSLLRAMLKAFIG